MICCYDKHSRVQSWDFLDKIGNWWRQTVSTASAYPEFAPLAPFRYTLVESLRKRGIQVPSDFNDIVLRFYDTFIKKVGSFDWQAPQTQAALQQIAQAVIDYLLGILERGDRNEPQSDWERKIYDILKKGEDLGEDLAWQRIQKYIPWVIIAGLGIFLITKK